MSKGSEAPPPSLCKGTEADLNWKRKRKKEEEKTRFLVLFVEKKSAS